MSTTQVHKSAPATVPQIQCGGCQQKLPLRLTQNEERAGVWVCAGCNVSFVACCVREALLQNAHLIRLDERFFDITGKPSVSLNERKRAIRLASRPVNAALLEKRRSERVSQSLVVPGVRLCESFVPVGDAFPIMVANLSREGVGLVHDERIETEYLALEFSPTSQSPIQVIVRVVRQREITPPYFELGGEFLARLGSIAIT